MIERHAHGAASPSPTLDHTSDKSPANDVVELSVDEVTVRYPGQWVLMQVTAYDEDKWPLRGYVLAHHRSYKQVGKAWLGALAKGEPGDSKHPYYIFTADRLLRTGEELDQVLDTARQQDTDDPFRWPRV